MKAAILSACLASLVASTAFAETLFVIDRDNLIDCEHLGRTAEGFSPHKDEGMSSQEMLAFLIDSGVGSESANLLTDMYYSFDAHDRYTYLTVATALCVISRLQPMEIER